MALTFQPFDCSPWHPRPSLRRRASYSSRRRHLLASISLVKDRSKVRAECWGKGLRRGRGEIGRNPHTAQVREALAGLSSGDENDYRVQRKRGHVPTATTGTTGTRGRPGSRGDGQAGNQKALGEAPAEGRDSGLSPSPARRLGNAGLGSSSGRDLGVTHRCCW